MNEICNRKLVTSKDFNMDSSELRDSDGITAWLSLFNFQHRDTSKENYKNIYGDGKLGIFWLP
jgi:hypothetical protein